MHFDCDTFQDSTFNQVEPMDKIVCQHGEQDHLENCSHKQPQVLLVLCLLVCILSLGDNEGEENGYKVIINTEIRTCLAQWLCRIGPSVLSCEVC